MQGKSGYKERNWEMVIFPSFYYQRTEENARERNRKVLFYFPLQTYGRVNRNTGKETGKIEQEASIFAKALRKSTSLAIPLFPWCAALPSARQVMQGTKMHYKKVLLC